MEKIINYKLKDFFKLDIGGVTEYLVYLELLKPALMIVNPRATAKNNEPKTLMVKDIRFLSFGQVSVMRNNFQTPDDNSVFENISLVTDLTIEEVQELPIVDFYGVLASLQQQLNDLSNMEENALKDEDANDESTLFYIAVNASERMAKFGILNTINSIAGNDPTKWEAVQNLPYMTVFNWLVMDKTRREIERDINQLLRQKQKI